MILYADSSALIKLYIEETGSAAMAEMAQRHRLAVSTLAYAEVYATFARRLRESLLAEEEHSAVVGHFERDWQSLVVVSFQPTLLGLVSRLVKQHPLRGADAVHLASALFLQTSRLEITFAASDRQLVTAAQSEGLEVFNPEHAE